MLSHNHFTKFVRQIFLDLQLEYVVQCVGGDALIKDFKNTNFHILQNRVHSSIPLEHLQCFNGKWPALNIFTSKFCVKSFSLTRYKLLNIKASKPLNIEESCKAHW